MTGPDASLSVGEVIFEFISLGASLKVTAVDVATGVEAVIVGPASAARSDLETLALNKLRRLLQTRIEKAPAKPSRGLLA